MTDFPSQQGGALRETSEAGSSSLESIQPEEAVSKFLSYKEPEIRPQTLKEYKRKLDHFIDFCNSQSVENLNQLDGRVIQGFRRYRRLESTDQREPLSTKTMRDDMYLFRDFVKYLEYIESVPSGLSDKIGIPELGWGEGVRDTNISIDRLEMILEHLRQYQYASREHVVWKFHAHTGRRPGGLYAIDLTDLYLDSDEPYVELRHRPEETELKNGYRGEGEIYLSADAAQIFRDYINQNRIDVTTENDREPFLTSRYGRLSKSTMRTYVYRFSRPCIISGQCPHDQDIESCQAAQSDDVASKCPSSRSPYALRHGYITSKRSEGVPDRFISGRCDVSPDVLEKHYDERTESEKRELRKEVFDKNQESSTGGYA